MSLTEDSNSRTALAVTKRFRWRMRNESSLENLSTFVTDRLRNLLGEFAPESENGLLAALPRPDTLADIMPAVERIKKAIIDKENIFVFADYDVDGISAASMMRSFFREMGISTNIYIPDRFTEGYGLNPTGVQRIHSLGGTLIITVDNGISAVEGCDAAASMGIDVVVTDHHDLGPALPKATAILNPKQPRCLYPFKGLSGVGVAFQLLCALRSSLRETKFEPAEKINLRRFLDFVALGTIADMAPLSGVNHILCRTGLIVARENMIAGRRPGLTALLELGGWKSDRAITSEDVGFQIGPRLNAVGRLGSALAAEEILHTQDIVRARELAQMLDAENLERRRIERAITKEAIDIVAAMDPLPNAIVLSDANWHPGVVGLVASRLVERFYRPTLVFGSTEGKFRGSGRSTHALDLFSVLNSVRDNFVAFGGHFHAVGLTLLPEKIEWLNSFLNSEVSLRVSADDQVKPLDIDAEVSLENFDYNLLSSMETLEPFGVGNPRPRWIVRNAKVLRVKRIGKDPAANHARVLLTDGTVDQWLTAFGMAADVESALSNSHTIDVIVDGRMQIWHGESRPELRLLDCSVRRTL